MDPSYPFSDIRILAVTILYILVHKLILDIYDAVCMERTGVLQVQAPRSLIVLANRVRGL